MTGLELWLLTPFVAFFLARWKERSGWRWGMISSVFPPALLILIALRDLPAAPRAVR